MIRAPVIIFTDDPGWHGQQLARAFAEHSIDTIFVSLKDIVVAFCNGLTQITIPRLPQYPPLGIFVRGIPGGSLQQVIARLDILHMLQRLGVPVYNEASMIERTVDKAMTSFVLLQHTIQTPCTWVCEARQQAVHVVSMMARQGKKVVLKPLFGSQGQGVRLLQHEDDLPVPMSDHVDGLYYLQEFIPCSGMSHDFRIFLIDHEVVGAAVRYGQGWINNVAQGGHCVEFSPDDRMISMAQSVSRALNIYYCGVDIITDQHGQHWILEVNSIPAWKGLQGVVNHNIAERLVTDFLDRIPSGTVSQFA